MKSSYLAHGVEPQAQVSIGINDHPVEALERWNSQVQGREVRHRHHHRDHGTDWPGDKEAAKALEDPGGEAPLHAQKREDSAQWAEGPPEEPRLELMTSTEVCTFLRAVGEEATAQDAVDIWQPAQAPTTVVKRLQKTSPKNPKGRGGFRGGNRGGRSRGRSGGRGGYCGRGGSGRQGGYRSRGGQRGRGDSFSGQQKISNFSFCRFFVKFFKILFFFTRDIDTKIWSYFF